MFSFPLSREELERKAVKYLKDNLNEEFIQRIERITHISVNRVLELYTLLLNVIIYQNYFPNLIIFSLIKLIYLKSPL